MSGQWVEFSILVGHEPVGLSVQRLAPAECERAAAEIAWFTHQRVNAADILETTWQTFIEGVICQHVTFTIAEDMLDKLGQEWWNELLGRALSELVRVNELTPVLNATYKPWNGRSVPFEGLVGTHRLSFKRSRERAWALLPPVQCRQAVVALRQET